MSRVRARVLELRSRVSALMPWRGVPCRAVPSPLLLMSSRVDITGTYSPLQYTSLCIISPAAGLSLRIAFPRVHVSCLVLFSSLVFSSRAHAHLRLHVHCQCYCSLLFNLSSSSFCFSTNATYFESNRSRVIAVRCSLAVALSLAR